MEKVLIIPELHRGENGVEDSHEFSRCSVSLFVANAYLEGFSTNAVDLFNDPELSSAFNALRTRLNVMMDSVGSSDLEIKDIFCVIERGRCNG